MSLTLEIVLETYLLKKRLSGHTVRQYKQLITRCLADWLDMPITEISQSMCLDRHAELCSIESTRASSGGKGQANYCFRTLRALLNWAEVYWQIPEFTNPVAKFGKVGAWSPLADRTTWLNPDQLTDWHRELLNLQEVDRDYYLALLLTGSRRAEIGGLEWSEVDYKGRFLWIPKERTKTKKTHTIAMSRQLEDLLRLRQTYTGAGRWVFSFPDRLEDHYSASRREHERIEEVTGVDCNPHVLRRTFASIAKNYCGYDFFTVKRCLNHATTDITERYIQTEPELLRPCYQSVADFVYSRFRAQKPRLRLTLDQVKNIS